jgi:hypothetical protein
MLEHYPKLDHEYFIPDPFQIIFSFYPTIQNYIVWAIYIIVE